MKFLLGISFVLAMGLMGTRAFADVDAVKGKALFTENKCMNCHSVESAGIKAGEDASKALELSGTGKDGDAAYVSEFLEKKAKAKSGKLHPKKWKGSPEDLAVLAAWMASLNTGEAPSKLKK